MLRKNLASSSGIACASGSRCAAGISTRAMLRRWGEMRTDVSSVHRGGGHRLRRRSDRIARRDPYGAARVARDGP